MDQRIQITGRTRLYGVIGDPVEHLRTPELLNPILAERGADIIAVPFHVAASNLADVWSTFRAIRSIVGIGVSMPHKAAAASLCDSLQQSASRLRVVSAVRREPNGRMIGAALDGPAFVAGLKAEGHDLTGASVLLIGAGGAGRAIAWQLLDAGCGDLRIANRNHQTAESLVSQLNDVSQRPFARAINGPSAAGVQIIVNATSLGLQPQDPLPIAADELTPQHLVVDIIARPENTALLQTARGRGCSTHSGVHMIRNHMRLVADFLLGER